MSGQKSSKKDSVKTRILLDTKPLIKLFAREDGWQEVRLILSKVEANHIQGSISVLSLTEIYCKYLREGKPDLADERVRNLRYANYLEKIPIDEQIATKAGEFKGKYSISVVDAIIAATGWNSHSLIVTDDLDFRKIDEIETLTERQYSTRFDN